MTKKEANDRAIQLAEVDHAFIRGGQREWSERIGCSTGLISKLPFWKVVAEQTGRARRERPRVIALTAKALATTADPSAELERLKAEQRIDRQQWKVRKKI